MHKPALKSFKKNIAQDENVPALSPCDVTKPPLSPVVIPSNRTRFADVSNTWTADLSNFDDSLQCSREHDQRVKMLAADDHFYPVDEESDSCLDEACDLSKDTFVGRRVNIVHSSDVFDEVFMDEFGVVDDDTGTSITNPDDDTIWCAWSPRKNYRDEAEYRDRGGDGWTISPKDRYGHCDPVADLLMSQAMEEEDDELTTVSVSKAVLAPTGDKQITIAASQPSLASPRKLKRRHMFTAKSPLPPLTSATQSPHKGTTISYSCVSPASTLRSNGSLNDEFFSPQRLCGNTHVHSPQNYFRNTYVSPGSPSRGMRYQTQVGSSCGTRYVSVSSPAQDFSSSSKLLATFDASALAKMKCVKSPVKVHNRSRTSICVDRKSIQLKITTFSQLWLLVSQCRSFLELLQLCKHVVWQCAGVSTSMGMSVNAQNPMTNKLAAPADESVFFAASPPHRAAVSDDQEAAARGTRPVGVYVVVVLLCSFICAFTLLLVNRYPPEAVLSHPDVVSYTDTPITVVMDVMENPLSYSSSANLFHDGLTSDAVVAAASADVMELELPTPRASMEASSSILRSATFYQHVVTLTPPTGGSDPNILSESLET